METENTVTDSSVTAQTQDLCLQNAKNSDLEPAETDKELSGSSQLLKMTLKSFQQLSLNYGYQARNISEQLLKDPQIANSQAPQLLKFKQNLTEFQQQYNRCSDLDELFDLVELYSNTSSFYYELDELTMDADSKIILGLLRKYGSEDLDNSFEKLFNVFVDKFEQKLESLKADLQNEPGTVGKQIVQWYETFKTLNDYDDKIDAFEKYFKFYEEKTVNS